MISLLKTFLASTLVVFTFSSLSHASGSYGGSGSYNNRTVKNVDQNYENGKAIYTGRKTGVEKFKYCVDVEGELKPLRRSSLQNYKRADAQVFADSLYDCDSPDKKIVNQLSRGDMLYVLYYLNKRFKLYLS